MRVIVPEDTIGREFLSNPTDNDTIGNVETHRTFIVKVIEEHDNTMTEDPTISHP